MWVLRTEPGPSLRAIQLYHLWKNKLCSTLTRGCSKNNNKELKCSKYSYISKVLFLKKSETKNDGPCHLIYIKFYKSQNSSSKSGCCGHYKGLTTKELEFLWVL